jgi:peroxiredoxin
MKIRFLTVTLLCCFSICVTALAQASRKDAKKDEKKAAAPKTPADLALDDFNKARSEPGAKDQARFQKVINAGIGYLTQYPTHGSVTGAVNNLAFYANAIDKKQAALRTSYLSLLKLEVANAKYKDGVTDNAKAALAAVEAAIADFEARENMSRDNLMAFREKLDELTSTPGSGRFLPDRERSYLNLTTIGSPQRAEEHAKKLLEHKEKGVKDVAREELNILEAKKQPYDLKFTAVDGKQVDLAQLRGKVVALYFWSSTNKRSTDDLAKIRQIHSDNKKKGLELVTVSYDKEEDREKLMKFIKDNKVNVPVHFDGKGSKSDFGSKLNVYNVPRLLVFDQKGILFTTVSGSPVGRWTPNLDAGQIEPVFKSLTAPAKKK